MDEKIQDKKKAGGNGDLQMSGQNRKIRRFMKYIVDDNRMEALLLLSCFIYAVSCLIIVCRLSVTCVLFFCRFLAGGTPEFPAFCGFFSV